MRRSRENNNDNNNDIIFRTKSCNNKGTAGTLFQEFRDTIRDKLNIVEQFERKADYNLFVKTYNVPQKA